MCSGLSELEALSLDRIFELAANLLAQGEYFEKLRVILSGSIVRDDLLGFLLGLHEGFLSLKGFTALLLS